MKARFLVVAELCADDEVERRRQRSRWRKPVLIKAVCGLSCCSRVGQIITEFDISVSVQWRKSSSCGKRQTAGLQVAGPAHRTWHIRDPYPSYVTNLRHSGRLLFTCLLPSDLMSLDGTSKKGHYALHSRRSQRGDR